MTMRRGACPTLSAPMKTGDGLLARIAPAHGVLTPEKLYRFPLPEGPWEEAAARATEPPAAEVATARGSSAVGQRD